MLTIRKFKAGLRSLSALKATGMFGDDAHQVLIDAVTGSLNLLVCGGTGAGKTTLLNALAREINPDERVITLEDAAELSVGLAAYRSSRDAPPEHGR
jgi:pilus assembly protein CpaF